MKLRHVLCDTRQSKLPLKLREPHGWLFGPERRDSNTDAVDSTSRIGRLLRTGRCGSVFLHDARPRSRRGHQCSAYVVLSYVILTHTMHAQATLLLRVYTLSNAGRFLHSRHTTHTAFLPNCHFTRDSVCVFMRWGCVDDKQPWLHGWASPWRSPHKDPPFSQPPR